MTIEHWKKRAEIASNDFEKVGWLDGTQKQFRQHESRMKSIIHAVCPLYGSILDIGCGYGRFSNRSTGTWTGVDFCEEWRDEWLARPEFNDFRKNCKFIIADCSKPQTWMTGLGPFDAIVACGVIGNMGWDKEMFLDQYRFALKTGGCFVVSPGYNTIEVLT